MTYTQEQADDFYQEHLKIIRNLQELQMQCVAQGDKISDTRVREHMLHGASRRIGTMIRSVENIYSLFPPSQKGLLQRNDLADVQINLHAFVINLYGIFDNWAWSFVIRHGLESAVGRPQQVGIFSGATQRYLPAEIREYVQKSETVRWFEEYLKVYRDALAHRIPLYVPPAAFTPEEGERFNALSSEEVACISSMNWQRLDAVRAEQDALGVPCVTFLHAFTEKDPPKPVYLHPQILSDSHGVVAFGRLYLEHWHNRA